MDMYRIEGEWVEGHTLAAGQTFELVAGFTEKSYIASGNWFGAVKDFETIHPFVLTDNGYCRYSGGRTEIRYFSIVKRPVKVGEIFELTWADRNDVHCYKITKVAQLNINSDYPGDEPQPLRPSSASPDRIDDLNVKEEPGIFFKRSLIKTGGRPQAFKASVSSLIDYGNAIAVGENEIESVFNEINSFNKWFESFNNLK
jgi:hypothetical protein